MCGCKLKQSKISKCTWEKKWSTEVVAVTESHKVPAIVGQIATGRNVSLFASLRWI
jgi:hypothetical protein